MEVDAERRIGVYFGTTNGEVWGASTKAKMRCLAAHLPHVYSVEVADFAAFR